MTKVYRKGAKVEVLYEGKWYAAVVKKNYRSVPLVSYLVDGSEEQLYKKEMRTRIRPRTGLFDDETDSSTVTKIAESSLVEEKRSSQTKTTKRKAVTSSKTDQNKKQKMESNKSVYIIKWHHRGEVIEYGTNDYPGKIHKDQYDVEADSANIEGLYFLVVSLLQPQRNSYEIITIYFYSFFTYFTQYFSDVAYSTLYKANAAAKKKLSELRSNISILERDENDDGGDNISMKELKDGRKKWEWSFEVDGIGHAEIKAFYFGAVEVVNLRVL